MISKMDRQEKNPMVNLTVRIAERRGITLFQNP
ncbi:hypothetical protein BH23ACT11_BH23ACT11_08420 [soil metagenome]